MNVLNEMLARRSVRKYDTKPVPDDVLADVLESGRVAPSGSNCQPWRFIVMKSDDMRARVAKTAHDQKWMMTAPVFIALVADPSESADESEPIPAYADENSPEMSLKRAIRDTSIAAEHMVLTAQSHGLGTCWIGWYAQREMKPVLGVPDDKYVLAVLTVGYPAVSQKATPRKALDALVCCEKWQLP